MNKNCGEGNRELLRGQITAKVGPDNAWPVGEETVQSTVFSDATDLIPPAAVSTSSNHLGINELSLLGILRKLCLNTHDPFFISTKAFFQRLNKKFENFNVRHYHQASFYERAEEMGLSQTLCPDQNQSTTRRLRGRGTRRMC